ncbi:hypothetical protein DICVIV_01092 [Dictyocaulus viviparus]|uniref:Uncharacterized protein n=1 Tax=Dictyocaulus viviparus TaxID=29172 RepID=A0A0D8Y7E4_DICVI|nr:hypothetical protein DICVIV_01092 [Dictyocaulus viviparus]
MIHLHLGQSACLPNEANFSGKVTINNMECQYSRLTQPTVGFPLAAQSVNFSIMETLPRYYNLINDKDAFLEIVIPDALVRVIQMLKCITIAVDVVVMKPTQSLWQRATIFEAVCQAYL